MWRHSACHIQLARGQALAHTHHRRGVHVGGAAKPKPAHRSQPQRQGPLRQHAAALCGDGQSAHLHTDAHIPWRLLVRRERRPPDCVRHCRECRPEGHRSLPRVTHAF